MGTIDEKKQGCAVFPAPHLLAAAVGFALASSGAYAQSADQSEEIIVRGRADEIELSQRKFTAPLLDTPKSVTVVTSDLIEQRGATSLVEALKNVPGITFNAGEGGQPVGDNLKIRGFDAGADVFIDGVRDAGSQTRDVFALEQIEVVKGTSSAYGGRGATGGAVNLVTKRARHDSTFVRTNLGAGTDEYLRAALDTNIKLSDSLALRMNALAHDADVPGRDHVDISHRGFAPSLAFELGTRTRLDLDYYYYRTDDMPDYSTPYSRNADNTAAEGPPVDVDRDNFYGLVNRDFLKTGADIGTLRVDHEIGQQLNLRATLRHGETSNDYIVTNPDDSRANVANGFVLRNTKSRNSETTTDGVLVDLSGSFATGRITHTFAGGVEFGNEEMYNRNYSVETTFGSNANTDFANSCSAPGAVGAPSNYNCTTLANPNPLDPWTGTIEPSGNATQSEIDTRSLYFFDTLAFNEQWSLNLGLRYDDYETRQRSGPVDAPSLLENQTDFVNHQIGLVFKPVPNASVYLSSGTSSNPSGNTLGDGTENLSGSNVDLEPERNQTYELGTKWSLADDRVALSAAIFDMEKKNARVSMEPGRGAPQQTVGEQTMQGFELGVYGAVTERWSINASYTHLDSEIIDDGPIGTDEGNRFPNTPEHSASLWTTYDLGRVMLGVGANYVDQRFGNTSNTVWAPSYTTYDAMASFAISDRSLLQLNLQNLTDEVYFVRPYASHYASIGQARSAVLSASIQF